MAFFNEFPHTRTYDSDLAWLIKRMKELLTRMDDVDALAKELRALIDGLPDEIRNKVISVIRSMIDSGEFADILESAMRSIFSDKNNFVFVNSSGLELGGVIRVRNLECRPCLNGLLCALRYTYVDTSVSSNTYLTDWSETIKNNDIVNTSPYYNETFLAYAKRMKSKFKDDNGLSTYEGLYPSAIVSAMGGGNSPYLLNTTAGFVEYASAYLQQVLAKNSSSSIPVTDERSSCVIRVPARRGVSTSSLFESYSMIAF